MYKILVIDDDAIVREMLQKILRFENYECLQASNATAGLETCRKEKPDLILLDVHLPDGNGIEVCRKIKSDAAIRHIPILIMTGEALDVQYRLEGMEAGADDYVLKPFNHKEFLARIQRVIKAGVRPSPSDLNR